VATANISGYELGVTYHPVQDIKLFVNYTMTDAKDGVTWKDLTYRPRTQYNAGIEYNNEDDDSAGVLIRHVGQRYDNLSNTRKVDAYTVTDINFRHRLSPSLLLSIAAENFCNADYQDTFDYPMPGRIYTFGIQYNLI
jgi:vitamin B12 transporter